MSAMDNTICMSIDQGNKSNKSKPHRLNENEKSLYGSTCGQIREINQLGDDSDALARSNSHFAKHSSLDLRLNHTKAEDG